MPELVSAPENRQRLEGLRMTWQPTKQEKATTEIKARLDDFLERVYSLEREEYPGKPSYDFLVDDGKAQLWSCRLPKEPHSKDGLDIWLYWDGAQIQGYTTQQEAFVDFINEQKTKRIEHNLALLSSTFVVSAALATLLTLLIAALLFTRGTVPQELWTAFTAITAFYFARGLPRRTGEN